MGANQAPHHQTPRVSGRYTRQWHHCGDVRRDTPARNGRHRAHVRRSARPRATRPASASRCSRASSPTPTAATGRSSSSSRAGPDSRRRARRAGLNSPGWLERALTEFRVLMLDQRGTGRSTPVGTLPGLDRGAAGRLPRALPSRLDRARRRVDPARARRRALERARPELRRLLRDHLSLARPEGLREALHHRRPAAARPAHRRGLRGTYGACSSATAATTSATRATASGSAALHERIEATEIAAPVGRPADLAAFSPARAMLGMSDGAERLHYIARAPAGLARRSRTTSRPPSRSPATRSTR